MTTTNQGPATYTGGCHCGAVRYEVSLDLGPGVSRCNCSICHKLGKSGVVVKPEAFRLLKGEADLADYRFGSKVGAYRFCKHCGVHAFGAGHLAELGGDFVSINAQCLDDVDVNALPVRYWDGRHDNWQAGTKETPWPIAAA